MKFTKMSLVAALLIGSSAFAIDNVKVSGDAKLYYATAKDKSTDAAGLTTTSRSLFNRSSSAGQAALGLGLTADLAKGISSGIHATVLSSLGLENNLVSGTWAGNITPGATVNNNLAASNGTAWWVDQAWIAATIGKTTGKVGRMELDTPLAFTEKWNIAENTFESAVLINQDLPDTTLVAAYVGASNGDGHNTVRNAQNGTTPFRGYTTYNSGAEDTLKFGGHGTINGFGGSGAYGFGVVNNSVKPLTLQAWYYDVAQVANAYWLQADVNMNGIIAGAQYANMKLKKTITVVGTGVGTGAVDVDALLAGQSNTTKTTDAYALMVGYAMKDVVTVKAAYSQVADNGILSIQNTATGAQSKLYTEAWWNYGIVGQSGAKSYMLNAEATAATIDFLAQYTHSDVKHKGTTGGKAKADEFTVTASKSFGPLDTTLAYVYFKATNSADNFIHGSALSTGSVNDRKLESNMIQAYLTLNF